MGFIRNPTIVYEQPKHVEVPTFALNLFLPMPNKEEEHFDDPTNITNLDTWQGKEFSCTTNLWYVNSYITTILCLCIDLVDKCAYTW